MFCESILDIITLTFATVSLWYFYQKLCDVEQSHKQLNSTLMLVQQELKNNSVAVHSMHTATNKQLYDISKKLDPQS